MANSKAGNAKGRREKGRFIAIPAPVLESDEYAQLSPAAVKLMVDLNTQFKGHNNGDLSATWSMMKKRGWKSSATLFRALTELLEKGWIVKTRQGGRHKPNLFALSYLAIDDCAGKLDIKPTAAPPGTWKNN